jgi:hypothetical protein
MVCAAQVRVIFDELGRRLYCPKPVALLAPLYFDSQGVKTPFG